jgi:hypothetical protein
MIRSKEALERVLIGGGHLRETRIHEPESKVIWTVAETGETVNGAAVRLTKEKLRPMADGLFGDAQTYGWAG